jgi:hypothetical protein
MDDARESDLAAYDMEGMAQYVTIGWEVSVPRLPTNVAECIPTTRTTFSGLASGWTGYHD